MRKTTKQLKAVPQIVRIESLESRVLYSAEAAPFLAFVDPDTNNALDDYTPGPSDWDALDTTNSSNKITEIVLVDQSQPDIQTLLDQLYADKNSKDHIAIVTIDSDASTSAIESITDALSQFENLNAIHVISHASDGALYIDGERLTTATLNDNAQAIKQWGESLHADGDILLYGCNLSATLEGQTFAQSLSSITGADVASSNDITGHALQNGDWDLEVVEGHIETESAISLAIQNDWNGALDVNLNLAHHYEFQKNGVDSVGSADITLFNNVDYALGEVRLGADFDSDTVGLLKMGEIDPAQLTTLGSDFFTVALWIKTTDLGAENMILSNMQTSATGFQLFTDASGEVTFLLEDGSIRDLSSNISIADGNWYHVTATRGDDGLYIRIHDADGVEVDYAHRYSIVSSSLVVDSTEPLRIGALSNNASDFDGQIDDLRIYTRDFTNADAAEVAALATVPQQQSLLNNYFVTMANNSSWVVSPNDLLTVDNESGSQDLTYTLTSPAFSDVDIKLNGVVLDNGDTFTQQDVDNGLLTFEASIHPTNTTPQIDNFGVSFDVSDPSSAASTGTIMISVNVDANQTPVFDSVTLPASISEATTVGTVVGSFAVSDTEGDSISVQVLTPNDAYFSINASNQIVLSNPIDFENLTSLTLTLLATDGYSTVTSAHAINIDDENDASTIASAQLTPIDEDTANPSGDSVFDLVNPSFSDDDAGATLSGIAITSHVNEPSKGDWEYSIDGTTWIAVGVVSSSQALALPESALIRFNPDNNYYGVPQALAYRALDNGYSQGFSANGSPVTIDTTVSTGDYGPISKNQSFIVAQVLSVNDSPQVPTVQMPSVAEDNFNSSGATISSIYDPLFSDLDDFDTLAGIVVTRYINNPAEGAWEYSTDATNWHHIGTVSNSQSLVLSAASSIRFVPAPDYNGTPNQLNIRALDSSWSGSYTNGTTRVEVDTITRPSDSPMSFGNPSLNINVTPVNDAPVASNDAFALNEGNVVTGNILVNDSDTENDPLTITIESNPINGTISVLPDGSLEYTHSGTNTTSDSFTYSLNDGTDDSGVATVQFTITTSDDAPIINSVTLPATIGESTPVGTIVGSISASDEEGDPFTLSIEAPGDNYFSINGSNQIVLSSALDHETDPSLAFDIRATAANSAFDSYAATISVTDENEAPAISAASLVAIDEDDTNPAGELISALFSASLVDVDSGASLSGIAIDRNTEVADGDWQYSTNNGATWFNVDSTSPFSALVLESTSLLRFLPAANFNGTPDHIEVHALDNGYGGNFSSGSTRVLLDVSSPSQFGALSLAGVQLTTDVLPINDAPTAAPLVFNLAEGAGVSANVLSNDSDIDGDALSASVQTNVANGTLTLNPNGDFTYNHDGGTSTTDSFVYSVSDGNLSSTATVTFNIATENDTPVIDSVTIDPSVSEAAPVGTVVGSVTVSDADNDPITVTIDAPGSDYFSINASNQIVLSAPIDYETLTISAIDIRATDPDGAFSTYNGSIQIVNENEAPTITNASLAAINEDSTPVPSEVISDLFDAGFSDNDAAAWLTGIAIDINTESAANGIWEYSTDGTAWHSIAITSDNNALVLPDSAELRFNPATNYNGSPIPIELHALDNGYTGAFTNGATRVFLDVSNPSTFGPISLGGVELDATVLAVNDVPDAINDTYSTAEDTPLLDNVTSNDFDVDGDIFTATVVTGTSNGSLNFSNDGSFSYTHNQGTATSDSFTYRLSDGTGNSTIATVDISITTSNDAPTIDSVVLPASINESLAVGSVLGSVTVSDIENETVTVTIDSPNDSIFTVNASNQIILASPLNHEAQSSINFDIRATDSNGAFTLQNTSIIIDDVNEAPAIGNASINAILEDAINPPGDTVASLFASSLADDDATTSLTGVAISANASGSNGQWQFSTDGTQWQNIGTATTTAAVVLADIDHIRFLPGANFNGNPTPLSLRALDDGYTGAFSTAASTVTIDVSNATHYGFISLTDSQLQTLVIAVNDAPVANNDNFTTNENTVLTGNVLSNDTDIENDTLTTTLISQATNGSVNLLSDGSFTYTHNGGTATSDTFTYQVSDGTDDSTVATVTITINTSNDAPVFDSVALPASIIESSPVGSVVGSVSVSDIENDTVTVTIDSPNDTLFTVNASNQIILNAPLDHETQPSINLDIRATDTNGAFTIHNATIAVDNDNEAPSIANGILASIQEDDTSPTGDTVASLLSSSFVDVDAGASFVGIAISANATSADGQWQFSTNGTAWQNIGIATPTAAIVLADSHSLRFLPNTDYNGNPAPLEMRALDDGYTGGFSTASNVITIDVSNATHYGSIALTDTQLITSVLPVNDTPVANDDTFTTDEDTALTGNVLNNDSDVENDSLTATLVGQATNGTVALLSDGSFTYTHNGGVATSDTFTYQTSDGNANSTIATVSISINTSNDAPVANNDNFTTNENTALTGNVLSNDTDIENDTLTTTLISQATNGSVNLLGDGSFTYTHNGGIATSDTFTYQVSDGTDDSTVATVIITINTSNDAPVFDSVVLPASIIESSTVGSVVGSVSVSDIENDTVTVTIDSPNDTLFTVNASNQIILNAPLDHETQPSINLDIRATDTNGAFTIHNATIDVDNDNEAPSIANGTLASIQEDNTNPAGDTVASLLSSSFSDVDAGAIFTGIAISNSAASNDGQWQYSIDGTQWQSINNATPNAAVVLADNHLLRFLPNADFNGNPTPLSVRALDDGYTGSFSTATNLVAIDVSNATHYGFISLVDAQLLNTVLPINDDPTIDSVTLLPSIDESSPIGTLVGSISASDIENGPVSLSIDSPANTYFTVNSSNQIELIALVDHETQPTIDLTIRATDSSGAFTTQTATIAVNDINETPAISSAVLASIDEDTTNPQGSSVADLFGDSFVDVDANASLSGIAIAGNTETQNGSWQYSNDRQNWQLVGSVSATSALTLDASSFLRFLPVENYNGTPEPLFIHALDNGFAGAYSTSTPAYVDIDTDVTFSAIGAQEALLSTAINPVNDSPNIQLDSLINAIAENTEISQAVDVASVSVTDPDSGANVLSLTGLHAESFQLSSDGSRLQLIPGTNLDTESFSQLDVTVNVDDASIGTNVEDSASYSLNVTDIDEAPILGNIETVDLNYVENAQAINISESITVTEPDNGIISSATIIIASGFSADQDELIFSNTSNINGQYNSATGVLTLTGPANASDFQEAIRSVAYLNSSDDPSVSPRVIEITATDSVNNSNTTNRVINVEPINDEQELTVNSGATIEENGTVTITSDMLTSNDVDNEPSSIVYSKPTQWESMELLVDGIPAQTFTQLDVDLGLVAISVLDNSTIGESLPLMVSDGQGEPLEFDLIISVTPVEPQTGQLTVDLDPIEFIPVETLSETLPASTASILGSAPTSESNANQEETKNEGEASSFANQESNSDSESSGEDVVTISIPEPFTKNSKIDFNTIANELSTPDKAVKRTTNLSAQAAADLQLASLMSLEPITIDTQSSIKLNNSETALVTSLKQMQEQLARVSEKTQPNATIQDTVVGFSLSITAGFLIWVLRGGALLASLFAISPLWKNLDPLLIVNSSEEEGEQEDGDETVEDLFDKS